MPYYEDESVRSRIKSLSNKYNQSLSAPEPWFDSLLDNESYQSLKDAHMEYYYSQGPRDQTETCG